MLRDLPWTQDSTLPLCLSLEAARPPTLEIDGVLCLLALRKELLEPEEGLGKENVPTLAQDRLSPREGASSGCCWWRGPSTNKYRPTPFDVDPTPNNGLEDVEDVADLKLVGRESL